MSINARTKKEEINSFIGVHLYLIKKLVFGNMDS